MTTNKQKKIRNTVDYYDRLSTGYDHSYKEYLNHTHERLFEHLNIFPGDRILDVSCGTGLLAEKMLKKYPDIRLVLNDPSDGMRSVAEKRLESWSGVEFTGKLSEEIQFSEQEFDCIICLNSFHYYTGQRNVIRKFYNILKPEGRIYLLDWNRDGWFKLPNFLISIFSPEHINTRSAEETMDMMIDSSFRIRQRRLWSYRVWKFYLIEAVKS